MISVFRIKGGGHGTASCGDQAPPQDLRHAGRGGRRVALRRRRGDLRHSRPERGRQDDHGRVRHRAPERGLGHDPPARPGPADGPGRDPRDRGRAAADGRAARQAAGRRDPRGIPVLLPRAGRRRRADRGARARPQARGLLQVPVRRPAAAAVRRAGAHRPPQDRGARRDDHRPGPPGPPRHLGPDRGHPRPRRDDRPGHPLHGGSRTALRPRGPDRQRPGRRAGHPGRPGRAGPGREDRAVPAVGPVRGPAADRAARGDRPASTRASTSSSPGPGNSSTR